MDYEMVAQDEAAALIEQGKKSGIRSKCMWRLDLSGLDLSYIGFDYVDMYDCDLRYSDLSGSTFYNCLIQSVRGLVSVGSLGSRNDILFAWRKYSEDRNSFVVIFTTGCFEGTEKEFREEIKARLAEDPSGYAIHAELYRRAINLLKLMLQQQYPFESKY